jgi:hypothetical protein
MQTAWHLRRFPQIIATASLAGFAIDPDIREVQCSRSRLFNIMKFSPILHTVSKAQ